MKSRLLTGALKGIHNRNVRLDNAAVTRRTLFSSYSFLAEGVPAGARWDSLK